MLELLTAALLILLNGIFALSELAIVSAKPARLKAMEKAGRRGARAALALSAEPGRFLSTVQIGITLVGIVAGAFSGAALAGRFDTILEGWGAPTPVAEPLAYAVVIGAITYFSVVVGELVPKRLALRDPEGIACMLAPLMAAVSRLCAPAVWLLDASSGALFRLMGASAEPRGAVTEQEIRSVVAEAESAGVIETGEGSMIHAVLRLGDRTARGVMTPRPEVEWIDRDAPEPELRRRLTNARHSRLPVVAGGPDNVVGVVRMRDIGPALIAGGPLDLAAHVRPAPVTPDTVDALQVLETLRGSDVGMAIVHDEYGHFEGVVTAADMLAALAGAFRDDAEAAEPEALRRADGSWLLAGWMPADRMAEELGVSLPARRDYQTVAGLVIALLRRLPATGEAVEALGWRFEVLDLDGRRIDKVLASRLPD